MSELEIEIDKVENEKTLEIESPEIQLDLSVGQLDGVGAVTTKKLESFGITNIIDVCVRGGKEVSEHYGRRQE
jgi:hypothetical protein